MEVNYFTILYWFCYTSTWIRYRYTCVPHPEPPNLLPPHTISLGLFSIITEKWRPYLSPLFFSSILCFITTISTAYIKHFLDRCSFTSFFTDSSFYITYSYSNTCPTYLKRQKSLNSYIILINQNILLFLSASETTFTTARMLRSLLYYWLRSTNNLYGIT